MPPDSVASDAAEHHLPAGADRAALQAVTRLLGVAADLRGTATFGAALVGEVRDLLGCAAALLAVTESGDGLRLMAASPERHLATPVELDRIEVLAGALNGSGEPVVVEGEEAADLDRALGAPIPARMLLVAPVRAGGESTHVLVMAAAPGRGFAAEQIELAALVATGAAAALAQLAVVKEHARQSEKQSALARAAASLNESLDLGRVLARICHEAADILDADNAAVYRGDGTKGVTIEAAHGMPPEAIGYRLAPGSGLAGKVAALDEPLLTNDYPSLSQPDRHLFTDVCSCLAVPMRWDGALHGVLAVGYKREQRVSAEHLATLEAFGQVAAAACRNASVHAGLARAARTDGLTGCLNHAAMHDSLRREIERCERTGHRLSLVLVDMDDFKQVNEMHGHLMGDEVLRRVGQALKGTVRPYDMVARYGGDEFAIVAVESDEAEATELAGRALRGVERNLEGLQESEAAGGASAGIAQWTSGEAPTELIERADRALMYGKQVRGAGSVIATSDLPDGYRLAPARHRTAGPVPGGAGAVEGWPARSGAEQTERLTRRTRQLATANVLGTRLTGMNDPPAILRAAVGEFDSSLGYRVTGIFRVREDGDVDCAVGRGEPFEGLARSGWIQSRTVGLIGRCLLDRRPVTAGDAAEITAAADGDGPAMASELVVPLWVGEELWGAVAVQHPRPDAFDEDDARLVGAVSDQIGSALRTAMLYQRLEGAYLGTAEALAAAVEAKDAYGINHPRTVVSWAQRVGARLGLDQQELEMLRFAAIFHDIGKVAVPEAILNKRGPLTPAERGEIERHTVVGEQILSTVDFLKPVLPLVRHEHERWDGRGYPDGLRGEAIPLGSRIILACDAYSAMINDRPYRAAMSGEQAGAELLAGAGTQFDARVVAALLELLEDGSRTQVEAVNSAR